MSPSALGHGLAVPPKAARRRYCMRTTQGVGAGCPSVSWEMEAGKCFRFGSRAYPVGPYMFLYRVTEVMAKVSFASCAKVISEPESKPIRSLFVYVGVTDNLESRSVFVEVSDCKEGVEVSEDAKGGPLIPDFGAHFRGAYLENLYLTEAYYLDYPKGRDPEVEGYTVNQFMMDNLVPVVFFVSYQPVDDQRAVKLPCEMCVLNCALANLTSPTSFMSRDECEELMNHSLKNMPTEVVGGVRLHRAEVVGNPEPFIRFEQDAPLEVKVLGNFIYPPEDLFPAALTSPAFVGPLGRLLARKPEPARVCKGMQVPIEVSILLEHADMANGVVVTRTSLKSLVADEKNGPLPNGLRAKCVDLIIDGELARGGDPMADSWVPRAAMMRDIEINLTQRLNNMLDGDDWSKSI